MQNRSWAGRIRSMPIWSMSHSCARSYITGKRSSLKLTSEADDRAPRPRTPALPAGPGGGARGAGRRALPAAADRRPRRLGLRLQGDGACHRSRHPDLAASLQRRDPRPQARAGPGAVGGRGSRASGSAPRARSPRGQRRASGGASRSPAGARSRLSPWRACGTRSSAHGPCGW